MNLIDAWVTEILTEPYLFNGKWFITVKAESMGRMFSTTLIFQTKQECENVGIGYKFLC